MTGTYNKEIFSTPDHPHARALGHGGEAGEIWGPDYGADAFLFLVTLERDGANVGAPILASLTLVWGSFALPSLEAISHWTVSSNTVGYDI
jgi:hypothetical protein